MTSDSKEPNLHVEITFTPSAVYQYYNKLLEFEKSPEYRSLSIPEKKNLEMMLNMLFESIIAMSFDDSYKQNEIKPK